MGYPGTNALTGEVDTATRTSILSALALLVQAPVAAPPAQVRL